MNQSVEMVKTAYAALSDKKGEDISVIDICKVSVMADYLPAVTMQIRFRPWLTM